MRISVYRSHNGLSRPGLRCRLLISLCALAIETSSQLSAPIVSDDSFLAKLSTRGKEFRERTATELENYVFAADHSAWKPKSECEVDVDLLWTGESGASIYSTPTITDLYSDGKKDVVTATFVRFLDVLEAEDGDHLPGWPFTLNYAHFHSSPLLWDADSDGVTDILYTSFNGEIFVMQEDGTPMHEHTHRIPPLRVKRDWYVGLDEVMLRRRQLQTFDALYDQKWGDETWGDDFGMGDGEAGGDGDGDDEDDEDDALTGTDEYYASWDVFGAPSYDKDEFDQVHRDPIVTFSEGSVGQTSFVDGDEYVLIDAHVLSTPVLADVEGDGGMEIIVAVSYYYDKQYYADNDVESPSDEDIDMSKYVAGGVVAISLGDGPRKETLWNVHLDLTTELTVNQATIYAPPTVVDLDSDGVLDVIIGTGMGFIYVLDARNGKLKPGFPVEMGPIQAGVACGDVDGDGAIDIVACDTLGNIAAFKGVHASHEWRHNPAHIAAVCS